MNFTKIEIIGFKSFANKTELRFDHGITGIVGPNGCGKSNVADAIRWVLGEQSAKSLRGSSMQDVIFNGTQNRKSLSYCEVSLYFDNSTQIFKSEPHSEVILTRKLYRNGDSEYLVNKQPRRLKDIVNLLHECGLSKEGYTIIGQNKVTEILSSKPNDRRAIFEEAVGISKTKAQRLETERKLQKTVDNITRFSDICMNLERTLAPLAKEADKAKEYNILFEDLKKKEVNAYLYKVENAASAKSIIQNRLQAICENLDAKNNDYTQNEKEYNDSMAASAKSDEEIKVLHDEILQKTVGLEAQKGKASLYTQKIEFFNGEIDRLREENTNSQNKINDYSSKLAERKSNDIKNESELQTLISKTEQLGTKLVSIISEINEGESFSKAQTNKEIESLKSLSDIKSSISSLTTEKNVITEKQQEVVEKVDTLKSKLQSSYNEKTVLTESISTINREISSLNDEIEASENGIKVTNDKVTDVTTKLHRLNNSITTLEANEKFYRGLKDSFEGYQEAVRRLMLEAKTNTDISKKIKGVVASILHTDKQYETAIEVSIGNAIQYIVTENEKDAAYLIEYLRQNNMGRATFLPINTVKFRPDSAEILEASRERGALGLATKVVKYDKYYEPIIRFLLGNTLVCDTLENATAIARKYRFAFKIVTLLGDVLTPQGTMSGGSKRSAGSNILSIDSKVEQIQKDLSAFKAEYASVEKKKNQHIATLASLNDELSEMRASLTEKKQGLVVLKEKLAQCETVIIDTENEIEGYREALKIINTRLSEISRKYNDIEEGSHSLTVESETASSTRIQNESYYEDLKKERDKLIMENTTCQSRIAALKSEMTSNKAEITRLSEEINILRSYIRDNDKNILADNEVVEKLKIDAEKVSLSAEDQQIVGGLREKMRILEEQKDKYLKNIENANIHREQLNLEISKLSEEKLKEEFNLEKVDLDLQTSADRIKETYELDLYEDMLVYKYDEFNPKTATSEIEKLKRNIRSLGNVDLDAIKKFEEENNLYEDYRLQKEDLEKGAEDLRQGIQALTEEMTTKFNNGFEVIRANFRKIFKELFGGGSADLLLDYENCDDPLEAGVEIVAEPPGKKLQKISLLSGGEMALTAIAILFAILRLCPMPFCVLDEIEAALDEANVERFARYLKNFSAETQFIVITHKKVTMELADALFGVTMQEKGVSSIVSVELAEAQETAFN